MWGRKLLEGTVHWQSRNIDQRKFVLFLSFIVGLLSGLAAIILKNIVHFTYHSLLSMVEKGGWHYLFLGFPLIGILLTVLFVKFFVKDKIGHGVSKILYSISKNNSHLKAHNNYSSMIASTLTVGFGGSVGLEAPIVLTGSAFGSSLGRIFKLNHKTTTLLIGCGAAGAIAGIFKAPIAATIFALEVLMLDLTVWSIIPLLISSVTGATVAALLLGKKVEFAFSIVEDFSLRSIPWYIVLGILCGFVSLYFTKGIIKVEGILGNIKNEWNKLLVGGIGLGILIFFFPSFYGEGYDVLRKILGGNPTDIVNDTLLAFSKTNVLYFSGVLLLIIVLKVIATALTSGSGGVGGIFAPTLFMGGITGYFAAQIFNLFNINVSERNFSLVAMAGLMAGVMHAPLTAIFLIAEITGGYKLFIPLIIVSTVSYLTMYYFEKHSVYTYRLAQRGELLTHHKDKNVLKLLSLKKLIEKDFKTISPEMNIGELVKIISKSKRNIFPVLDEENNLIGVVSLDEIREIIFDHSRYEETFVKDLMFYPEIMANCDDTMEDVMKKFESAPIWNMPVIDNKKYIGFISKSKIFNAYREMLVQFSDE